MKDFFSKRNVSAGTIISLYNGIRISLKKADVRPWLLKPNLLCLNDGSGLCVDVTPEQSDLKIFCNTTGHKCNHHWDNNAVYDFYWGHPIFGKIRCIRTIKEVKRDEEFFVDYGYEEGTGPHWYEDFMKGHWKKIF